MKIYDEIIIGGGICGIMAAKRLIDNDKTRKVAIVEKGRELTRRKCPASESQSCVHCGICSITSGMAGAGAFSDGKFNLGTAYGGTLGEELGEKRATYYIDEVDRILSTMGMSRIDVANDLAEGKKVRITDGPFKNMVGKISTYDLENKKVELLLDLFGQETTVEVGLSEIENLK